MAAAPHGDAHGAEQAAGGAFPPFDVSTFAHQLVWFAITFGALYWFLSRHALPQVARVLETRATTRRLDLDAAAAQSEAAEQARQQAERASAAARAEARKTVDDMRAKMSAELAEEQAKVDTMLAERIAAAEARIGEARAKALASVDDLAADAARDIVAKLMPRSA